MCMLAEIPDTVLKMLNLYPKYSLFYSWIIWEGSESEFPLKKTNYPTFKGLGKG